MSTEGFRAFSPKALAFLRALAVREHIAANHRRLRAIVESPGFKKAVGALHGEQLQRTPRGFASDHPAAECLKYRQFLAGREFPGAFATSPRFHAGVLSVFRQVAPLTKFLNEPLLAAGTEPSLQRWPA